MRVHFAIKSRGAMSIKFGKRCTTISGELTFEPPVFYADLNSFGNWDSPHQNEKITEDQRNEIVRSISNSDNSTKIVFE